MVWLLGGEYHILLSLKKIGTNFMFIKTRSFVARDRDFFKEHFLKKKVLCVFSAKCIVCLLWISRWNFQFYCLSKQNKLSKSYYSVYCWSTHMLRAPLFIFVFLSYIFNCRDFPEIIFNETFFIVKRGWYPPQSNSNSQYRLNFEVEKVSRT